MYKWHVWYNKKMKTFIYPWMKDIHSLTQNLLFIMPSPQPKQRMHKWRVRYDKKMKTFIYPWIKLEPDTFLTMLEPEPQLVLEPNPLVEPEQLVEPEPVVELEPFMEPEPVVEPKPFVEPEPLWSLNHWWR